MGPPPTPSLGELPVESLPRGSSSDTALQLPAPYPLLQADDYQIAREDP